MEKRQGEMPVHKGIAVRIHVFNRLVPFLYPAKLYLQKQR